MNSTAAAIIERFELGKEDRTDGEFYLGHVPDNWQHASCLMGNRDWYDEAAFACYPYRVVLINLLEFLTLTYTEGDLRLEVFDPKDAVTFYEKLAQAAKFYAQHLNMNNPSLSEVVDAFRAAEAERKPWDPQTASCLKSSRKRK